MGVAGEWTEALSPPSRQDLRFSEQTLTLVDTLHPPLTKGQALDSQAMRM